MTTVTRPVGKARENLAILGLKLEDLDKEIKAAEDAIASCQSERDEKAVSLSLDGDAEAADEIARLDSSIEDSEAKLRTLHAGRRALEARIGQAQNGATQERRIEAINEICEVRHKEEGIVRFLASDLDDLGRHLEQMLECQQRATKVLVEEFKGSPPHQLARSFSVDAFLTVFENALGSRLHRLGIVSLPRSEVNYSLAAHVLPAEKIREIATAAVEGKK